MYIEKLQFIYVQGMWIKTSVASHVQIMWRKASASSHDHGSGHAQKIVSVRSCSGLVE